MSESPRHGWANSARETALSVAMVLAVAMVVGAIWAAIVHFQNLPAVLLPSPQGVWDALVRERDAVLGAALSTGIAAVAGLATAIITGSLIAIAFSLSNKIKLAFFPYVVFLQTVPIVGIAPLLVIWSGYRFRTTVIATAIICLFPIISNTTAGLLAARSDLTDLFRLYGSGRWRRLWSLQIPTAVPYLMLGIRISSGMAVIGAIVAELFISSGAGQYPGLGTFLTRAQANLQTDALMAALLASTVLGLIMFSVVQLISVTVLRRWTRVE